MIATLRLAGCLIAILGASTNDAGALLDPLLPSSSIGMYRHSECAENDARRYQCLPDFVDQHVELRF
jgi:hypothetical protein